jgi:hypothetical protein
MCILSRTSRLGLGPLLPPVQWLLGLLFLGLKWSVCEADHTTPCSVKVKNECRGAFTSTYTVMVCTSISMLYLDIEVICCCQWSSVCGSVREFNLGS